MSIKTNQAILKCFIDLKSSVFQKQQTQLTRGDFSRRFSAEAVMTSNVACHAMLWTENSNEHPKTRDQQKHDIEIPQNRLVWSGSRLMIVQNSWIFSICGIHWEYETAAHLMFWKPRPAIELKKTEVSQNTVSSSEPSVNQTLDLRSIKHFRIAWLVLIDIW